MLLAGLKRCDIIPTSMDQNIFMNPNEISLSNLLRRVIATSIDLMLLYPAFFTWWYQFPSTVSIFWEYSSDVGYPVTQVIFFQPVYALPFFGIAILYFSFFEGWLGATPGKFLLRERVLTLQGERIAFFRAFVRNVLKPIDFVTGIIFFLVSRRRQTLGDMAAGTIVIKKNTDGLPIAGTDVALTNKLFAVVTAVIIILIGSFLASLVLKIREVDQSALAFLQKAKETRSTERIAELYQVFSHEMRDNMSLEEFIDSFEEPTFRTLLDALEVGEVMFYDWEFSQNTVALLGEANDIVIELILIKNEKSVWKPSFLRIY